MQKLVVTGTSFGLVVGAGLLLYSSNGRAQQAIDPELQAKILKGFQIAPVPLNMGLLDPNLVGYGSFLVNTGGCNDCHSAGPTTQYTATGNPFFGQVQTTNPATYLGGGRDFGAFPADPFPHIVSRNLTPDFSGLPEGGNSFSTFQQIMRTGLDTDHVHPTCKGAPDGTCIPPPFNGDLLQIMPWPGYQSLTDHDLLAIYTYLAAIPCVEGGPGEPANRCGAGAKTFASAKPKNATLTGTTQSIQLDGSGSKAGDGGALLYSWTIAPGSKSAPIFGSNIATPTVLFGATHGTFTFQLTVTDSKGNTATDFAIVNY